MGARLPRRAHVWHARLRRAARWRGIACHNLGVAPRVVRLWHRCNQLTCLNSYAPDSAKPAHGKVRRAHTKQASKRLASSCVSTHTPMLGQAQHYLPDGNKLCYNQLSRLQIYPHTRSTFFSLFKRHTQAPHTSSRPAAHRVCSPGLLQNRTKWVQSRRSRRLGCAGISSASRTPACRLHEHL